MTVDAHPREGARAKAWRRAHGLSRRALAELTGYGESTVNAIEAGSWAGGRPIDPATMRTYRLACAAVALGVAFDWADVEMRPLRASIRVPLEATVPAAVSADAADASADGPATRRPIDPSVPKNG